MFEKGPLGIVIEEKSDHSKFISSIKPDSQASKFKNLYINDLLMSVAGTNVAKMPLKEPWVTSVMRHDP